MTWPDPKCTAKHGGGGAFMSWQHTKECRDALSRKARKNKIMPESTEEQADPDMVDRGRKAGAL